jgi:3-ketoacyl-CoA synthase
MGGAACLMTSGRAQRRAAKYELLAAERVTRAASDASYGCMFVGPDEAGLEGIHLYKDLPAEAGRALTAALARVAPRVMDWRQFLQAAVVEARRRYHFFSVRGKEQQQQQRQQQDGAPPAPSLPPLPPPPPPRFRPDWTRFVDHFLLHAGGYGVLQGIKDGMGLPTSAMLPSFANLKDYGNTSSSTTWYAWAYLEATSGVRRGERVLQAGVGGGMKAAVCVWRAVRDVPRTPHRAWAHLPGGRAYGEEDMPRPITVVGTLTGLADDGRPAAAAKGQGGGRGEAGGGGGGSAQKQQQQQQQDKAAAAEAPTLGPDSPKTPGRGAA